VVVTGRVAAGKTTLLRVLLGLLPRQGGAMYWNETLVEDPAEFFVPPRCAYTSQVPRLFSDTLRGNILLGVQSADAELERAVARAQLMPDLAELLEGLETPIGPRGISLSGGQIQRAAVARMLVRQPELLVLDDLSMLDVKTEALLWERLRADEGSTILAVSHRRSALRAADRIVVLQDGFVEATGTLEELLKHSPEMQRLCYEPTTAG
jgi:ATP-binding cassette subfamily B protein